MTRPAHLVLLLSVIFGVAAARAQSPIDVAELRARGPSALAELLAAEPKDEATHAIWSATLDAVCAQKDCAASRLYWYTDLDEAIVAARSLNRPIVSLRLLGRLDEEVSCANSRFFRTVLYPDPVVGALLRDEVVLHWESVRPVPKLSIDFGDGRRLEGTITGNSIHYLLDANGRLIDAIPGLYGAGPFVEALRENLDLARMAHQLSLSDEALAAQLAIDHALQLGSAAAALGPRRSVAGGPSANPPSAQEAMKLAMAKMIVEAPVIAAITAGAWQEEVGVVDWTTLAARLDRDQLLSPQSRALLADKHPQSLGANTDNVIARFLDVLAQDTVRNQHYLKPVLNTWLGAGPLVKAEDLGAFTDRVYADLFLTPSSDPWLGLVHPETYMALEIAD